MRRGKRDVGSESLKAYSWCYGEHKIAPHTFVRGSPVAYRQHKWCDCDSTGIIVSAG